ncbi:hypothetical protein JOM56_001596 [Amanita muscaria]
MSLPFRGACNSNDCHCDQTVYHLPWRTSPSHAEERCLCGHPYWQHKNIGNDELIGGCKLTGCGGFYPKTSLQCVCGQTREQHVQMPEFQPEPISNATIAGSHPALAYSTAASGAFQLWVPSPPSTGTVQQQRVASSSHQRSTPNRQQSRYNQLADTGSPAVGTAPTPLAGVTADVYTKLYKAQQEDTSSRR